MPSLLPPQIEGRLLPRHVLDRGLTDLAAWSAVPDAAVDAFERRIAPLLLAMRHAAQPNEAETESELILPVLRALGWYSLPQQSAGARREDRPDALLFADAAAHPAARGFPLGSPGRLAQSTSHSTSCSTCR